ncbi:MAG TPA: serine protease [Trichocoleus sp.]|jgi:hypothetical protein
MVEIFTLKTSGNWATKEQICQALPGSELCEIATDGFPEVTEFQGFSEPLQLEEPELLKIIESRLDRLDKALSSGLLSVGDPDYLFSEFLGRGLRCSDAVCLLVRGLQLEELIDTIKDHRTKDIPEILRWLSRKLKLLSIKEPGGSLDRWIDKSNPNKKVADVLEDPVVKEELSDLRKRISEQPNEKERLREATIYIPFATGFLVGKNYLTTNFHVFNDKNKKEINKFLAYFRYEINPLGEEVTPIVYELDSRACISDKFLDFTIVKVKPNENYEEDGLGFPEAGDNFGWFPMFSDPTLIAPPIKQEALLENDRPRISGVGLRGEPAFVIQHPGGGRKRIVLFNNSVQEVYQKFLAYETDVSFCSSGSAICNEKWQLVGLHHSTIAKLAVGQEFEIQGNLGTRMCAIVDFLEKNKENEVAQDLLANNRYVVKTGDVPVKGKIYLLSGYQRPIGEVPSPEQVNQEVELAKFLLEKVWESSEKSLPMENVLETAGSYENGLKALMQREDYQSGDIAVEIRINLYPEALKRSTQVKVYYAEDKPKLKAYADALLNQMRSKAKGKIETGNLQAVVKESIDSSFQFCTAINVPAFLISLDFYGQDFDQIERTIDPGPQSQELPLKNPIVDSLKSLVKIISPIGFLRD